MRPILVNLLLLGNLLTGAAVLPAQEPASEWNSERVQRLVDRTVERRSVPHADSALVNYQAMAHGYVYFYLARRDTEDRTLVKVDQLAIEVMWGAPNRSKQRIVGMRDVSKLPNRMHYHLDHLVVVLDEFGDRIRMGDGDEVRDVPHPAAPGADSTYEYRLADSLTIRLPGSPEPVRVYEIEVRPLRFDDIALIGSMFVDRGTADIVRMTFTFTPASYIDHRLEHIKVSIENGLWNGRHWLPHEQRLEIRRQVPELDFPVASVIRGVLRIGEYEFNQPVEENTFRGYPVVAAPRALRERYDFPSTLFQDLDAEGLAPPADLTTLRQQARTLALQRDLSGLPRLRFYLPHASAAARYNRMEGPYLGAGAAYAPGGRLRLEGSGGYAAASRQVSLAGAGRYQLDDRTRLRLRVEYAGLRDLGIRPGAAGAMNTILTATFGRDHLDPYTGSGAHIGIERRLDSPWQAELEVGSEEHRSPGTAWQRALFVHADRFRPLRPVDEGRLTEGRASIRRLGRSSGENGWKGQFALDAGTLSGDRFLRPVAGISHVRRSADRELEIETRATAGIGFGRLPAQRLFLLGGAGTLPGYRYRGIAGDRFALAEFEVSRSLLEPWLRLRGTGAVGWADFADGAPHTGSAAEAWLLDGQIRPNGGIGTSLGIGAGLFYDILRLDLARGLNDGFWQLIFSVNPGLWDFL